MTYDEVIKQAIVAATDKYISDRIETGSPLQIAIKEQGVKFKTQFVRGNFELEVIGGTLEVRENIEVAFVV